MDAAGFGSPVASPGYMNVGTPNNLHGGCKLSTWQDANSPLLFKRTPTPPDNCIDSSKKFGDWVAHTSPYAGQKTPPSVAMKSVAAGVENTPPAQHPVHITEGPCNSHRFQAWLTATGRTSWTPKQDANAATPPRVPAQTPAGTPMSISHIPASAASPATKEPCSRPLNDLAAFDTDSDGDEADTVVGVKEVAAAAARMRAALLSVGTGMNHAAAANQGSGMVSAPGLRAPAPSPVVSSPVSAAPNVQQAMGDSLTTPMSQLSMSNANSFYGKQTHAAAWRPQLTPGCSKQAPSSPVAKVIGLMLETGQPSVHGDHHFLHSTPSRLAGAGNSQAPRSPEQQIIQLMLQQQDNWGADPEDTGAATTATRGQNIAAQLPRVAQPPTWPAAISSPARDADAVSSVAHGSEAGDSSSGTESDDEIDVAELQQLVGAGAGPSSPLQDIISMMLTPQLKVTPHFTFEGAQAANEQLGEVFGPRVLFTDD